jgi:hypothetical protein
VYREILLPSDSSKSLPICSIVVLNETAPNTMWVDRNQFEDIIPGAIRFFCLVHLLGKFFGN